MFSWDIESDEDEENFSAVSRSGIHLLVFLIDASVQMKKSLVGDETLSANPESTNAVDDLRFLLMVSKVKVLDTAGDVESAAAESADGSSMFITRGEESESGCTVSVRPADAPKCERCWYHCSSVGSSSSHPTLCSRCASIVERSGFQAP